MTYLPYYLTMRQVAKTLKGSITWKMLKVGHLGWPFHLPNSNLPLPIHFTNLQSRLFRWRRLSDPLPDKLVNFTSTALLSIMTFRFLAWRKDILLTVIQKTSTRSLLVSFLDRGIAFFSKLAWNHTFWLQPDAGNPQKLGPRRRGCSIQLSCYPSLWTTLCLWAGFGLQDLAQLPQRPKRQPQKLDPGLLWVPIQFIWPSETFWLLVLQAHHHEG